MATQTPSTTPFGRLLRHFRTRLGLSQEELAARAEVSVRHLSFLENGRAQPSREKVAALAEALEVRDPGTFLEAAGFLAPYAEVDLGDPAYATLLGELRALVEAHGDPAVVHDRYGTLVDHNRPFSRLVYALLGERPPQGRAAGHGLLAKLSPFVVNREEVAAIYRRRIFLELLRGARELDDATLERLYQMWHGPAEDLEDQRLLLPLELDKKGIRYAFRCPTYTLGTPQQILLRDFRLTVLMPADRATRAWLEGLREG